MTARQPVRTDQKHQCNSCPATFPTAAALGGHRTTHRRTPTAPGMKTCPSCDTEKPVDDYNYRNTSEGTRQPVCRPCQNQRNTRSRRTTTNPDPDTTGSGGRTWQDQAACRTMPYTGRQGAKARVDLFFATPDQERPGRTPTAAEAAAKRICWETCPVREDCEEFGLVTRAGFGIWGGWTPRELDNLRRARRRKAGTG